VVSKSKIKQELISPQTGQLRHPVRNIDQVEQLSRFAEKRAKRVPERVEQIEEAMPCSTD